MQLAVERGEFGEERSLPLTEAQRLALQLLLQTQHFGLEETAMSLESLETAVILGPLIEGQRESTSILTDLHRPALASLPHVRSHILQAEHRVASFIRASHRREFAGLRVFWQMLELHHPVAASFTVVAFDVQLENEVF